MKSGAAKKKKKKKGGKPSLKQRDLGGGGLVRGGLKVESSQLRIQHWETGRERTNTKFKHFCYVGWEKKFGGVYEIRRGKTSIHVCECTKRARTSIRHQGELGKKKVA